ncbi:MAG: aliphatic sulfonate ABC transporter substrate-binding protein [Lactobacillaceae bacterium]|jgi:sulfonate transport system substrate-binding protein|nr:aliphatic sulfonate ABC transporter substrate-binding protein [Lactobacillaceae bacterium]
MKKKNTFKKIIYSLLALAWVATAVAGFLVLRSESNQGSSSTDSKNLTVVNFGYQRGDEADIIRMNGQFAKDAKKLGYKIKWTLFQDGTSLLTALTSNHIQFGRTGNTPPVVSQASGTNVVYVGATTSKSESSMILVPEDSEISSIADLKGKTVAYGFGTSSTYFLIKALQSADLTLNDITETNLGQSAAATAFQTGKVDAWVTWDPYSAAAEIQNNAKVLTTAKGYSGDYNFFLSTKKWASKHSDLIDLLNKDGKIAMKWANNNHSTLIKTFVKELGLDEDVAELQVSRRTYGMASLSDSTIINEQQDIADVLYDNDMIDTKINVKDAIINE